MFDTTACKGSWNQEEQTEEGARTHTRARARVCVRGGGGVGEKESVN